MNLETRIFGERREMNAHKHTHCFFFVCFTTQHFEINLETMSIFLKKII